jgi:hypothetical protein
VGSNPAEVVGFFMAKKILSKPSFGGEVKLSVADLRHVKDRYNSVEVTIVSTIPVISR